jgi:hypothetical protein
MYRLDAGNCSSQQLAALRQMEPSRRTVRREKFLPVGP